MPGSGEGLGSTEWIPFVSTLVMVAISTNPKIGLGGRVDFCIGKEKAKRSKPPIWKANRREGRLLNRQAHNKLLHSHCQLAAIPFPVMLRYLSQKYTSSFQGI